MSGHKEERRPGVWTLRAELPRDPETGARRQASTTFRGGLRAADKALAAFVTQQAGRSPAGLITWDGLFKRWMESGGRNRHPRSETTKYQEPQRWARHVSPMLGEREVEATAPIDVEFFLDKLSTTLRRDGTKALSTTSVARVDELLRGATSWGTRRGLISINPMTRVEPVNSIVPKPKPPDTEAVVALLKYLGETDIRLWAAVRLAATTAARRSELIALKWSDLSWGKATLQLERGIVVVPGKGSIDTDTKTGEAGEGLLDLDEELMTALQIIRQEDGPDDLPLHKWPDGYILSNDRGVTHWHPDTLSSRVREAASHVHRAKGITLKQLRSYVASELATSLNFDVATAQAVLRHKSSSTTLRHYIAARERDSRQASRTIGEALADGKSKSSRENFTWMKDYKPLAPKKKS